MRTSNKNDATSISKLALFASAAATAAFVVSQTKLMQRLTELAPAAPPAPQPESEDVRDEDGTDQDLFPEPGFGVSLAEDAEADDFSAADHVDEIAHESKSTIDDHDSEKGSNGNGADHGNDATPGHGGAGRVRFRASRSARERLHYGLPVRHNRRRTETGAVLATPPAAAAVIEAPLAEPAPVTLIPRPEPPTPTIETEDFDAEYLALVEAIARDGRLDEDYEDEVFEPEPEAQVQPQAEAVAAALPARTAIEDLWWLPIPRLQYIILALAYVAISVAAGSDPATLAADGFHALRAVNDLADLIVVGWLLCGVILIIPLGTMAVRLISLATMGKLHRPGFVSEGTVESAGWSLRLFATAAFIAGAFLYSPHALSWALNTDHPVAAVSSSTMEPALHEGELVIIDGVGSVEDLNIGDIVVYTHEDGITVRRVTGFSQDGIVITADGIPDQDSVIQFDSIAGRVLRVAGTQVKLPLLGNISLLGERTVDPVPSSSLLP
jgi:hypothetical protein